MNRPSSISDAIASAEWEAIAKMIATTSTGVEGKSPRSRRLRTKAGLVKMILVNKLGGFNGNDSIDMALFISSFKTIHAIEREYDENKVKKREFITLLKLLLHKFGKQKLIVRKRLDMLNEFDRMKGVVENGNGTL